MHDKNKSKENEEVKSKKESKSLVGKNSCPET